VRHQTATDGAHAPGSSSALRLDPHSLPVRFAAHDKRADGAIRHIELHRTRVVLRREISGMRMAINVRVSDFLGVTLRGLDDGKMLMLKHRDSALSIPLLVSSDQDEIDMAWQMWSEIFALPQLPEDKVCDPAPRRRRRNAIRARRPKFLVRRRAGGLLGEAGSYKGEREIIARH
jgi:hypothetical protein